MRTLLFGPRTHQPLTKWSPIPKHKSRSAVLPLGIQSYLLKRYLDPPGTHTSPTFEGATGSLGIVLHQNGGCQPDCPGLCPTEGVWSPNGRVEWSLSLPSEFLIWMNPVNSRRTVAESDSCLLLVVDPYDLRRRLRGSNGDTTILQSKQGVRRVLV